MLPLPSSLSCHLFAKVPLLDVTSNHRHVSTYIADNETKIKDSLNTRDATQKDSNFAPTWLTWACFYITGRLESTGNQVEGQLWRHLMQLRDTLTVLLPDWYTQAKIAHLSHNRENWSQVHAILFQNWGVVVSLEFWVSQFPALLILVSVKVSFSTQSSGVGQVCYYCLHCLLGKAMQRLTLRSNTKHTLRYSCKHLLARVLTQIIDLSFTITCRIFRCLKLTPNQSNQQSVETWLRQPMSSSTDTWKPE